MKKTIFGNLLPTKSLSAIITMIVLSTLTSCKWVTNLFSSSEDIYYVYQEKEDGSYGMVSDDGTVIFEPEFNLTITSIINDRFFARTSNDLWEIYTVDGNKVKQVGSEAFKEIASFTQDVTVAARENGYCEIIDKDGKTKKVLDKINGKIVERVSAFNNNGIAVFVNEDGEFGFIDTSGKMANNTMYKILIPIYNDAYFAVLKKNEEKGVNSIINVKGEEYFSFKEDKYEIKSLATFNEKYLIVENSSGAGIIDMKGEYVVKPKEKYGRIKQVLDDKFIYKTDGACGVCSFDGETIIRPGKYKTLIAIDCNGKKFIAEKSDSKGEYFLMTDEEEKIGNVEFKDQAIADFAKIGGYIPVETGNNSWEFLDVNNGELKKKTPDIYSIRYIDGDGYISNNHLDIASELKQLDITENSVAGFSFDMSTERMVSLAYQDDYTYRSPEASNWTYQDDITFTKKAKKADFKVKIAWNGYIAHSEYSYDSYYYYGSYQYYFTSEKPSFTIEIDNDGAFEGKLDLVYDELVKMASSWGNVISNEGDRCFIKTRSGYGVVIGKSSSEVGMCWGPNVYVG